MPLSNTPLGLWANRRWFRAEGPSWRTLPRSSKASRAPLCAPSRRSERHGPYGRDDLNLSTSVTLSAPPRKTKGQKEITGSRTPRGRTLSILPRTLRPASSNSPVSSRVSRTAAASSPLSAGSRLPPGTPSAPTRDPAATPTAGSTAPRSAARRSPRPPAARAARARPRRSGGSGRARPMRRDRSGSPVLPPAWREPWAGAPPRPAARCQRPR